MPRRALVERRPWLLAGLASATAFYFLQDNEVGGLWLILLKGMSVGALALYAFQRHLSLDARLLSLALGLAAIGDMTLELNRLTWGIAVSVSHLVAIGLYARNRRDMTTISQKGAAAALLIGTPICAYLLTTSVQIGGFGVLMGTMAAAAWFSRFPRYRVGIGAVSYVASHLVLFVQMDGEPAWYGNLLIWPLYYLGQFLIATGIVQTLRNERYAKVPAEGDRRDPSSSPAMS